MRVNVIRLSDYRNLDEISLKPAPELTVLVGQNGQGKTNILESIWMLTGGKSFRGSKDGELVKRGRNFAFIESEVTADERDQTIRIAIGGDESYKRGRYVRLNGVERGRASSIAGTFTAVVFDPNHLALVKGSPEGRRKFLDAALCQLYPGYLTTLRRCLRVTTQKNALLKKYDSIPDAGNILEAYNEELARCGTEITRRRMEYLEAIAPLAKQNYDDISHNSEIMRVEYRPSFEGDLLRRLNENRAREIAAGFCIVGPHREDFDVFINGQAAKNFGSQGQQRSAVLSLKLAEAARAAQITGEHPVMLLDDVLSELDDSRQSYLLTRMEGKQTFVTSCDSAAFARTNGKIIEVKAGRITEV